MNISTIEGVVENGLIRLLDNSRLPEHAHVFVIVPELPAFGTPRIHSPRLVNPKQAADFVKEIIEETCDE